MVADVAQLSLYSLDDAIAWVESHLDDGVECPCCGQLAKRYRRSMYGANCRALIALHHAVTEEKPWHHIASFQANMAGGGDFAKARYWGLVAEQPNEKDETKRTSDIWTITDKGRAFVLGRLKIQKYALIFDSRCQGFDGELIDIIEALGENFNYQELMEGTYGTEVE